MSGDRVSGEERKEEGMASLADIAVRLDRAAPREAAPSGWRELASAAQEAVCSALCPSVKKTGEPWTHVELCERLSAAAAEPDR